MSKRHPLLKFLDHERGPIVGLQTRVYGENASPFFYSMTKLSPQIQKHFRASDILGFGGGGWSKSRIVSQEKAIVEGIERWAYRYYIDNDILNGCLDIDPTSNGFAALPMGHGLHLCFLNSACEAIERYLLNSFWIQQNVKLEPINCSQNLNSSLANSFSNYINNMKLYGLKLKAPSNQSLFSEACDYKGDLIFILALIKQSESGIVCGSACGYDVSSVIERATLEAINHHIVLNSFKNKTLHPESSITDKRLLWFGTNKEAELLVLKRVEENIYTKLILPEPEFIFLKQLKGPWEPEVNVTRAVVKNSPPITEGNYQRFMI